MVVHTPFNDPSEFDALRSAEDMDAALEGAAVVDEEQSIDGDSIGADDDDGIGDGNYGDNTRWAQERKFQGY